MPDDVAPLLLASRVTAVTVFRRGALVTRSAELRREGPNLPTQVQIGGLPLALDDSSVRVEIEGPGVAASELRVAVDRATHDADLPPPHDDELDAARLAVTEAELAVELDERARARLSSLQIASRGTPEEGRPPAASPTAARLELIDFQARQAERLDARLRAAHETLRRAREHETTLRERERVASLARNARTWELRKLAAIRLEVDAAADSPTPLRLRLSYFVAGARWSPAYTLRLSDALDGGTLELRALVAQATGEDWTQVALTLSTASPQRWTELPELRSRRIGRRQPPPAKTGWRPPPVGAVELYADYDREFGEPPLAAPSQPASQQARPSSPMAPPMTPLREEGAELDAFGGAGQTAIPAAASLASMPRSMPMPGGAPASAGAPPPPAKKQLASAPRSRRLLGSRSADHELAIEDSIDALGGVGRGGGGGGGGPLGAAAPQEPPPLTAARELLDYGRLRLFAGDDPQRGSLRRVDLRVHYRELTTTQVEIDVAIEQIDVALGRAQALDDRQPLPPGHDDPGSDAGFDYAYVAEAPISLASDGQFHSRRIDARALTGQPRYIAVPRESQDVFRIVALGNPLAAPLLPGPADVYIGERFALTTPLELCPADGRIELGLGVEQAIKIARNIEFHEDASGMFKRQLALHHGLRIEVANRLERAATVEIRERLPQASAADEDKITIELGHVEPAWRDFEQDDPPLEGGRVWVVEVPAGQERKLSADWTVVIPHGHELVGGNRREV